MQNCDSEVREVTMEMERNELIQKKEWPEGGMNTKQGEMPHSGITSAERRENMGNGMGCGGCRGRIQKRASNKEI